MLNAILMFTWNSLLSYITRRCSGKFMDEVFDVTLTAFANATPSKVDDTLVEKWKNS